MCAADVLVCRVIPPPEYIYRHIYDKRFLHINYGGDTGINTGLERKMC